MTQSPNQRASLFLLFSVVLTLLLYYIIPQGRLIAYPLTLLSTLVHEMGHGIFAILVGGEFLEFQMWSDGSGVARWQGNVGRLSSAFVAAGGLLGPAIMGGIGFWLGRGERRSRLGLGAFGVILTISLIFVVRGLFGMLFVGLTAGLFLLLAYKAKPWASQIAIIFLASQMALSVFSRGDYLFTKMAQTGQGLMPSDTQQMAEALLLPYWFWGTLCGLVSMTILSLGLWSFFQGAEKEESSLSIHVEP